MGVSRAGLGSQFLAQRSGIVVGDEGHHLVDAVSCIGLCGGDLVEHVDGNLGGHLHSGLVVGAEGHHLVDAESRMGLCSGVLAEHVDGDLGRRLHEGHVQSSWSLLWSHPQTLLPGRGC